MGRHAEIDRTLSRSIRREMGASMNRRFACSLPFLRTSDVLPTQILDLLGQLEEAERDGACRAPGRH